MSVINQNNIKNDTGVDLTTSIDSKLEVANIIAGTNVTLDTVGNDITINATGSGSSGGTVVKSTVGSYSFTPLVSNTSFQYSGSFKWSGSIDVSALSIGDTFEIINKSGYDTAASVSIGTYNLLNASTSSTLIVKSYTSQTFVMTDNLVFQQVIIGLPATIGSPYLNSTFYRLFNQAGESDILNYTSGAEVFCEGTALETLTISAVNGSSGWSMALTVGQSVNGSVVVGLDGVSLNFYWLDVNTGTYQTTSTITLLVGQRVTLFKSGDFINVMSSTMNVNPNGVPPTPQPALLIYDGAKIKLSANENLNLSDVDYLIPFDSVMFDTGGYMDGGTAFKVQHTGYYLVQGLVITGSNINTGNFKTFFTVNGVKQTNESIGLLDYGNSEGSIANISETMFLSSQDVIRLGVRSFNQDFGIQISNLSKFTITYLGG